MASKLNCLTHYAFGPAFDQQEPGPAPILDELVPVVFCLVGWVLVVFGIEWHYDALKAETNDHRLLVTTRLVASRNAAPTVLVTKDLNLQLKAHALDIPCEDYQNDKVDRARLGETGPAEVELSGSDLQRFASSGTIEVPKGCRGLYPNEYALLRAGEKRTMSARLGADGLFHKLRFPEHSASSEGPQFVRPTLGSSASSTRC